MAFSSFLPESDFLKQFIAYYYCDGSQDPLYRNSYVFYPHVNTTVSLYQNAAYQLKETTSTISYDANVKYLKLVTQQSLPRRVIQIGKTYKIAIVFKPFGLNRFINEKYSEAVPGEAQIFVPCHNDEWDQMLDELFSQNDVSGKARILDEFLLRQYNGVENNVLEKAIAILSDVDNDSSIGEIAGMINVSRKTLLRYFKSELRTTPELFRTISRFRYALNEKILKNSPEILTELAYRANFFDQAYFIKRFKLLTGVTPTKFFKEGSRLGEEDTFWTFEPLIS